MTQPNRVEQTLQVPAEASEWAHFASRYQALQERALAAADVPAWLREWSDLAAELEGTGNRLSIQADLHTADDAVQERYRRFMGEVVPPAQRADQALKEKWLAVPGYQPTPDTELLYRRVRDAAALYREANVELGVVHSEQTTRHAQLTGGQKVTLGGEDLTVPQVKARLDSPDRTEREAAWRALAQSNQELAQQLNPLMLELLDTRRRLAANADLPDFRAYRWSELDRVDYGPEQCLDFHRAVAEQVVPFVAEQVQAIAAELGLDSVRPWDYNRGNLLDPQARPPMQPFSGGAALEDLAQRAFAGLDSGLSDRFAQMRAEGLLDLESRPGKMPHAYCNYFPVTNQPFVLMNVVGSAEDVRVLFHEVGHAFHGFYSGESQPLTWNRWSPIEFVEIPSMAMEFLTLDHLGHALSPADLARYRRQLLLGVAAFLPWAAQMDAFQHWLYVDAPQDVTVDDLNAKWLELDRLYHPFVNWDGLDETVRAQGWHYYHIFQVPFYYIEYAMCYLAAVSIWRGAQADPTAALERYKAALRLGSTRPVPELYAAAGAEFRFDAEYIGGLMDFLRGQLREE
ncbi:peptidase M3A and M3B thimet/oligopeptidase F [Deinococcus proteolyticus MRP]|uniref:Peptidase M3A and M3B thimet/oligopeptidase F n=1 Tax=Deinococcus proteolyticus (strain ATCC 35074 / DSM 20540 / JCM 6276 / NBRC 101906 / NCIMB 13154 / VKM Ac-1939 / CCM 2703 / MRP) TaxID=693977 RepID=F0RKG6_DEIPM|nr:M3 family oligoendopeptidase [Deinococcus proteolyticus]ADY26745.1 peptidase M3A and M3B thimet/oligopeptidase F [Deinococcus proteolyticus MRP]